MLYQYWNNFYTVCFKINESLRYFSFSKADFIRGGIFFWQELGFLFEKLQIDNCFLQWILFLFFEKY